MAKVPAAERVAAAVAALSELPRKELVEHWTRRFGRPPPKGCGRRLLELAAAFGIQEKAFGGLMPGSHKVLTPEIDATNENATSNRMKRQRPIKRIKPGTRLVREWNGRTHHVEMVEGGFVWNGKKHRSLSLIAREITGAHWSGPRFFGL